VNASRYRLDVILAPSTKNMYEHAISPRDAIDHYHQFVCFDRHYELFHCDIILHSSNSGSKSKPAMYTELHQDGSLSLFFNSLQEEQAGKYTCKGNYAHNVPLNKSVTIDTISKYRIENSVAF